MIYDLILPVTKTSPEFRVAFLEGGAILRTSENTSNMQGSESKGVQCT